MNPTVLLELGKKYGGDLLITIAGLIAAWVAGPEPRSLTELRQAVDTAVAERAEWLAKQKAAADALFDETATKAFASADPTKPE